jgi:hypothetical protein
VGSAWVTSHLFQLLPENLSDMVKDDKDRTIEHPTIDYYAPQAMPRRRWLWLIWYARSLAVGIFYGAVIVWYRDVGDIPRRLYNSFEKLWPLAIFWILGVFILRRVWRALFAKKIERRLPSLALLFCGCPGKLAPS